jgi:hypothetical protein
MAITIVLLWLRSMQFWKLLRKIGPFVIMLETMFQTDVVKFFAVLCFILPGLSLAISLLVAFLNPYALSGDPAVGEYLPAGKALYSLILSTVELDTSVVSNADDPILLGMFLLAVLLLPVLCLNLLVAMMNSTYVRVEEEANQEWALQVATYIVKKQRMVNATTGYYNNTLPYKFKVALPCNANPVYPTFF